MNRCIVVTWLLLFVGGAATAEELPRLGRLTVYFGGYWLLTWTFAGLCIYCVWQAWQHKQQRALAGKGVWLRTSRCSPTLAITA